MMNTTTEGASPAYTDEDKNNLKKLPETFASEMSLKTHDASALMNMKKCEKGTPKSKKCSASLGTVSNVIGKEYITPKPQSYVSCEKQKSVLLTSDDIPEYEIWQEEKELPAESKNESMDGDLEEFVYEMLGSGFGLDKNLIRDVIGQCGYNMQMSIDKLVELSAETVEKSKDVSGLSLENNLESGFRMKCITQAQPTVGGISERPSGSRTTDVISSEEVKPKKSKKDLQREVLEALFTLPDRTEEKPRLKGPEIVDKDSPYIVTGPPKEAFIEDFTFITRQPVTTKTSESGYEELRASAKENWLLMKEYYNAAVESFKKKEYEKAQSLTEKGHLHLAKAREAELKSTEKLVEESNTSEDFTLNVYHLEPRDAMRSFRLHLKNLSGLSSIQYIIAVTGTEGGGKKDLRRKNLITGLLEKEGIPWTEEGNGLIVSVRADAIDRSKLSFANK